MGPAFLRAGPSIAVFLFNQRFRECVSRKLAFRTVQALSKARAGIRRRVPWLQRLMSMGSSARLQWLCV
jgi:hypothetical protein